jgi:hypothetical protein
VALQGLPMNTQILNVVAQLSILVTTFILYLAGRNMMRVWSEMRTELSLLRFLTKNVLDIGAGEIRNGGRLIDIGKDDPDSVEGVYPAKATKPEA